eukprot:276567-Rhodomonas_salina.1
MIDTEYGQRSVMDKAYVRAKSQLTRLYDCRCQWAARWTWVVFTAGCHSTQRQESVHGALKRWIQRSGCTLVNLSKQIVSYRCKVQRKADEKRARASITASVSAISGDNFPEILKPFRGKISWWAMNLALAQWSQRSSYRMGECDILPELPDGVTVGSAWRLATRIVGSTSTSQEPPQSDGEAEDGSGLAPGVLVNVDSEIDKIGAQFHDLDIGLPGNLCMHDVSYAVCRTWCSCLFFIAIGLPCRHIFRYFDLTQDFHLPDSLFRKLWWCQVGDCNSTSQSRPGQKSLKYDRFSRLLTAFRGLAVHISPSQAATRQVLKWISDETSAAQTNPP